MIYTTQTSTSTRSQGTSEKPKKKHSEFSKFLCDWRGLTELGKDLCKLILGRA